jgi:23S rRNA (uracil1939-C5)-methyltransferase
LLIFKSFNSVSSASATASTTSAASALASVSSVAPVSADVHAHPASEGDALGAAPTDTYCPAPLPAGMPAECVHVDSLDLDAQGVGRRPNGKVVFIDGALPFEYVTANLLAIHRESSQRVTPDCQHFGLHAGACGGCKMQHLHVGAQVAVKQRVLEDNLWHLGKVKPETMLRPIEGPAWGYRYRARLSVRYVVKKGEVLIGFHERKSRYIADMKTCAVLPPHVSAMLMPLRALIADMDARDQCPQIELACGDDVTALVLRHMVPLSDHEVGLLRAFAATHNVQWWVQSKGPDTVKLLDEGESTLSYALPEFGITMPFKPTDFTQVNPHINRVLVARALRLLDVQPDERVIDWFCGLGNFTLPLATQARQVLGIEGSEAMVVRSQENYERNKALPLNGKKFCATEFVARNLFEMTPDALMADGVADKWLVDPPREGAFALVQALADIEQSRQGVADAPAISSELLSTWAPPQRIVYVSCNPATLARDAGLLVHKAGYRCVAAGMVNMFPHTAHVESMAVFER